MELLSEEEKKAIEYLKNDLEMTKQMGKKWGFQEEIKNKEITLNLIEKQQKEIEELKEKNIQLTNYLNDSYYVSADKIKEILKDLDEFDDYFFNVSTLKEAIKNSLKQLLEEN